MTTMIISVPASKAVHILDVLQHLSYVTVENVSPSVHKASKKKRQPFPKNHDNPSPGGDPYWDNPPLIFPHLMMRFRQSKTVLQKPPLFLKQSRIFIILSQVYELYT